MPRRPIRLRARDTRQARLRLNSTRIMHRFDDPDQQFLPIEIESPIKNERYGLTAAKASWIRLHLKILTELFSVRHRSTAELALAQFEGAEKDPSFIIQVLENFSWTMDRSSEDYLTLETAMAVMKKHREYLVKTKQIKE